MELRIEFCPTASARSLLYIQKNRKEIGKGEQEWAGQYDVGLAVKKFAALFNRPA